ncbi:hypothetical protein BT96DRAFT_912543 [Gymnopus androsaceus JB14]|uniref:CN hydrolase domain-containing protein n=1 Tax=Gymnopus androsaceus JB14 TaxID=1447944 RepID=A0A6A4IIA6_9AGAR|nr:hypothetical protein BT96DRAFT_912543 [Gymnopus androsaceus JB14]
MCAEISQRLRCHVLAGYPERLLDDEILEYSSQTIANLRNSANIPSPVGANSAVLYGPDGEWIGNYRKTNLFATDRTWAKAGSGFATFHLPAPIGKLSLGICMDLNAHPPADWRIPQGPYELADYALAQDSDTLILLNAWLDSGVQLYKPNESDDVKLESEEMSDDTDWNTVNFWAARLRPLWTQDEDIPSQGSGIPQISGFMGRKEEGTRSWNINC